MSELYKVHLSRQLNEITQIISESTEPPEDYEVDEWAEGKLEQSARVT